MKVSSFKKKKKIDSLAWTAYLNIWCPIIELQTFQTKVRLNKQVYDFSTVCFINFIFVSPKLFRNENVIVTRLSYSYPINK